MSALIFNRVYSQPSGDTFKIPPIADLIARYVGDGKGWIDPCAGWNSPAEITNDLNPKAPVKFHLHAVEFGMALALKKEICIIGPRENVFHCLPEIKRFDTWPEYLESIK